MMKSNFLNSFQVRFQAVWPQINFVDTKRKIHGYKKKDESNKLEEQLQGASYEEALQDIEAERYQKFKTYRELTEANVAENPPGIPLSDRHNYFSSLHPHIKADAMAVLNNQDYGEDCERQALDVFKALKITPRIKKFPSRKTKQEFIQIDTNCEYDVVFANFASEVYQGVLSYFRDMLD